MSLQKWNTNVLNCLWKSWKGKKGEIALYITDGLNENKKTLQALTRDAYGWMGRTCITTGRQNRDLGWFPLKGREMASLRSPVFIHSFLVFRRFCSIFKKFIDAERNKWGYWRATFPTMCWSSPFSFTRDTSVKTQIYLADYA